MLSCGRDAMRMEVPHFMEELNGRPGEEWTAEETARAINWWCERWQLKRVWFSAAAYLGDGATTQDIEDAVSQFYVDFDRIRRSYRSGRGVPFCKYLLNVCFKNYCIAQGEKIRKRHRLETSIDQDTDECEWRLDLEQGGENGHPQRVAEHRALLDALTCFLNGLLLPEKQKRVFVLRYLREMSYEEIAVEMGVSVGSVKGWLSRAKQKAREFLTERGWS
jgi:RNA polymerase sigma factor (sigma-70 family)